MLQKFVAWCFLLLGAPCFSTEEALAQRFNKLFDFGLDTAQQSAECGTNVFIKNNEDYIIFGTFLATPYVRQYLFSTNISADGDHLLKRDTMGWGLAYTNFYLGLHGSTRRFGNGFVSPYGLGSFRGTAGIVRFNADGDTIFTKVYTDTIKHNEGAYNVTVLPDSSILACGERDSIGKQLAWGYVQKIDKTGNLLWMKTYQRDTPLENRFMSIQGLAGDRMLVGGGILRRIYINNIQNNYLVNRPWFLILDSIGNVKKEVLYDTSYYGGGNVYSDANGGYFHWGYKDSLPRILPAYPHDEINRPYYVAHLDTNFNMQWRTTFSTLTPPKRITVWQVIQTKSRNYLAMGERVTPQGINGWAAKLDKQGKVIWEHAYFVDSSQNGYLVDAEERSGPEGGFVLTGWTRACQTCSQNIWLLGIDSNGCETAVCSPLAVPAPPAGLSAFHLYPNPTSGDFTVTASVQGQLELYNVQGACIGRYAINAGKSQYQIPAGAAAGFYLARYTNLQSGQTQVVRLLYQP